MHLIKKTLVGLIIPLQVLAASPSIEAQPENNDIMLEPEQNLTLIQEPTNETTITEINGFIGLSLRPFVNQMMPYIIKNIITNKNGEPTKLLDQFLLELAMEEIYLKYSCEINSNFELMTGGNCYLVADISRIKSLPELLETLENSYNIAKLELQDLTRYNIDAIDILQLEDKYYFSYGGFVKDEVINAIQEYQKDPANQVGDQVFFTEQSKDGETSKFSLEKNKISGQTSIPKTNTYQSYDLNISDKHLLNLGGLNLKQSLSEQQIKLIKQELGELSEILFNIKAINLETDGVSVKLNIELHNISEDLQATLDALILEQEAMLTSSGVTVEIKDNTIQALLGEESDTEENQTTNVIEKTDIIGHFYMNTSPISTLLEAQGINTPISIEAYTKDLGETLNTSFEMNLDLDTFYKLISEELETETSNIEVSDIQSEDWYYDQAKQYAKDAPELFKKENCEELATCEEFTLQAGQTITRAEFAALILQYTNQELVSLAEKEFEDLNSDHQYYMEMQTAIASGLMKGDASGSTIRPDEGLNRAEAITMLQRAFPILTDTNFKEKTSQFEDVSEEAWYLDTLSEAVYEGIIQGTSETTFSPEQKLNRIEAIIMVQRLMEKDIFM